MKRAFDPIHTPDVAARLRQPARRGWLPRRFTRGRVVLFGGLFLAVNSHEIACSSSVVRAAEIKEFVEAIDKQAEELRQSSPPDLPAVEVLRLKRLAIVGRAAGEVGGAEGRGDSETQPPDGGRGQAASGVVVGQPAETSAAWVKGMQAMRTSDALIDRMQYVEAFIAAHLGWEPFAASEGRSPVFGDGAAQLFKAWQAAATFDPDFWGRREGVAAAYVRYGLSLAARQTQADGKKLFEVWQQKVTRTPDFWRVVGDQASPDSRVREVLEKQFSSDQERAKRLVKVWQAAMRDSDVFSEAWQSPESFDGRFDVVEIVQAALEKTVSRDKCHLEAIAMLAYVQKPEPSESFQPAELRESLRKRNQRLLALGVQQAPDGSAAGLQERDILDVMPWEAPVEYLKAKSTSFILDDLKYYTGFLDDRSPLTGKDRRGEDFSVVLGGMLLVYADDNRSQVPVVARYLAEENRWQKLQLKLLRVGSPRKRSKKKVKQDASASLFQSREVEDRIKSLVSNTRSTFWGRIREAALKTADDKRFPSKVVRQKIRQDIEQQLPEDGSGDLASHLKRVIQSYENVVAMYPAFEAPVESAQELLGTLVDDSEQFAALHDKIIQKSNGNPGENSSRIIPRQYVDLERQMAALRSLELKFSEDLGFEQVEAAVDPPAPPGKPAGGPPPAVAVAEKSLVESLDATALMNVYGSIAWLQITAEMLEPLRALLLPKESDFGASILSGVRDRGLDLGKAADRSKFRNMNFGHDSYSFHSYALQTLRRRCDMLDEVDEFLEVFANGRERVKKLPDDTQQPPPGFAVSLEDVNAAYAHFVDFCNLAQEDSSFSFAASSGGRFQAGSVGSYDPNLARVHLKMQRQFAARAENVEGTPSFRIDDNEWAVVSSVGNYRLVPDSQSGLDINSVDLTTVLQTLPKLALADGVDLERFLAELEDSPDANGPMARQGRPKKITARKKIPVDVDLTMNGLRRHPLGEIADELGAGESRMVLNPDRIGETFLVVLQPAADDGGFEPEFIGSSDGKEKRLSLVVPGQETTVDFVVDVDRRVGDKPAPSLVAQFVRGGVLGIVPLRGRGYHSEAVERTVFVTSRMHEISRLPPEGGGRHFFKIIAREGENEPRQLDDRQVNYFMEDWRDLDNNLVNDFLRGMSGMHPSIPAWLLCRQELLRPSPGGDFQWADVYVE